MRLSVDIEGPVVLLNHVTRGTRSKTRPRLTTIRDDAHTLARAAIQSNPSLTLMRGRAVKVTAWQTYVNQSNHGDVGACAASVKSAVDGIIASIDGMLATDKGINDDELRLPVIVYRYGAVTGTQGLHVHVEMYSPSTDL